MNPDVESYLDRLCRRMRLVPAREREDTRREMRGHLAALAAEHEAAGLPAAEARERAMREFGDPAEIGRDLARQNLRYRIVRRFVKISAVFAGAAGVYYIGAALWFLFVDSKPLPPERPLTPVPDSRAMLRQILTAQEKVKQGIGSLRFQSSRSVRVYDGTHWPSKFQGTFTDRMDVAVKGDKRYVRTQSGFPARFRNKPVPTFRVSVFDGEKGYEVLNQGGHQRAFVRNPEYTAREVSPLDYSYQLPGRGILRQRDGTERTDRARWLADVLRESEPVVEGTVAHPRFGTLAAVRCVYNNDWGEKRRLRLWFALERGGMVVKHEDTAPTGGRLAPGIPMEYRRTYEITNAETVGGFWMPSAVTTRGETIALGRSNERFGANRLRFDRVAINDVPDTLFTAPVIRTGATVWDTRPAGGAISFRKQADGSLRPLFVRNPAWWERALNFTLRNPLVVGGGVAAVVLSLVVLTVVLRRLRNGGPMIAG